jgi:hypothetical protein
VESSITTPKLNLAEAPWSGNFWVSKKISAGCGGAFFDLDTKIGKSQKFLRRLNSGTKMDQNLAQQPFSEYDFRRTASVGAASLNFSKAKSTRVTDHDSFDSKNRIKVTNRRIFTELGKSDSTKVFFSKKNRNPTAPNVGAPKNVQPNNIKAFNMIENWLHEVGKPRISHASQQRVSPVTQLKCLINKRMPIVANPYVNSIA